ncbi:hypothetical protein [Paludisphaera sp.]|uniref:hypothetical protein n=1 Tax=Paludisphaera sp. TaxID=2017432 RepID=UPI00301CDCEA
MSILPKKTGSRHSANLTGRSYAVELIAVVDDLATGPKALRDQLAAAGFVAGQGYQWPLPPASAAESDPAARLTGMEVAQDATDGRNYTVTLAYQTHDPEKDNGAQGGGAATGWVMAPWLAMPTLDWSSDDVDFYPTHDREGNPLVNSAGDPFDPGPSIKLPTPIATVARVEQGFLPEWITAFKGRVNDAPWMGYPAESVLCKDITAKRANDPDWGGLYTVTYTFAFRPPITSPSDKVIVAGWDLMIANLGKRRIVAGKPEEIRDKDAQPISDPVFLDPDDGSYDPDSPPEPNYKVVPVYPTADFDFFNLPPALFDYNPGP